MRYESHLNAAALALDVHRMHKELVAVVRQAVKECLTAASQQTDQSEPRDQCRAYAGDDLLDGGGRELLPAVSHDVESSVARLLAAAQVQHLANYSSNPSQKSVHTVIYRHRWRA